jgi:hypothetical protein
MHMLRNENGVAMVTSLVLTLISLAITIMLLNMVIMGTKMSASQKRYRNALQASYGGVEVFTKEVIPRLFEGYLPSQLAAKISNIGLNPIADNDCMQQKLNSSVTGWTSCQAGSTTADPKVLPDMSFRLNGLPTESDFTVFIKIIDTVPGNSDTSNINYLDPGNSVVGNAGGISPQHLPSLFTIEVQGERTANPQEKAHLSVLYAY